MYSSCPLKWVHHPLVLFVNSFNLTPHNKELIQAYSGIFLFQKTLQCVAATCRVWATVPSLKIIC